MENNYKIDNSVNIIDKLSLKKHKQLKVIKGYDPYQVQEQELINKKYQNCYTVHQDILKDEYDHNQKHQHAQVKSFKLEDIEK